MSAKVETRSLQIRAAEGDEFVLVGRAVSYNTISSNEIWQGMREQFLPGAFKESLASGVEVKALLNHDSSQLPLGSLRAGTLKLTDSEAGLDIRVQLDKNIQAHRDVHASVRRGDISEMSFAFTNPTDSFSDGKYDGQPCQIRTVSKATLNDVSVVCYPAYGDGATAVAARAANSNYVEQARARLAELDADLARQECAYALFEAIRTEETRATDVDGPDDDEGDDVEEFECLRDAIASHFGQAAHGLTPKYFLASHDGECASAYDMNSADLRNVRIPYSVDDVTGDYHFGDPQPCDDQDADKDSLRAARTAKQNAELRFRMEVAAGRR